MIEPKGRKEKIKKGQRKGLQAGSAAMLIVLGLTAVLLLSGCTIRDAVNPLAAYFGRDASSEEETAHVSIEDMLTTSSVKDAEGRAAVKANGEPLTVMAIYETATGGEPRINSNGELETYPLGEVVTYAPGSVSVLPDGTAETYAGGEPVTNLLGLPMKDSSGDIMTRAAGEFVTHGADDIVYDENGERVVYSGEQMTYAAGESKYDTNGERETRPIIVHRDSDGEVMTDASGEIMIGDIEIMTEASGAPKLEADGEIATKQLDPIAPERKVDSLLEEGQYYINNITSNYVFFAAPEVQAEDIHLVSDEDINPNTFWGENGSGTVKNLQLEIIGESLPYFEINYDLEGYAYFTLEGTNEVLTLAGDLRNGVNVMPKEEVVTDYEQYKYWDDPVYTVADNQKWIIKDEGNGAFSIRSYLDENYAMTVDDEFGTQYANIMMWTYDGRDLQKFHFGQEQAIQKYFEPGIYYISSGLSNWMMMSIGDDNYYEGESLYLYRSDQGDGQAWDISYDDYGFAIIKHAGSDLALSVSGHYAADDQSIIQMPYDGESWQKWIIAPHKHGGYYIRSALNVSVVMDLTDGQARNMRSIKMHWNNDTFAESWNFHREEIPDPHAYETMDEYAQNFSSETEYLILIDQWWNKVGVYQGEQGKWTNIFYWDCVTGKSETPTVTGEFSIYAKSPSFDGNMDTPVWYTCYYASMWYPEYFFHSIIYYQGTWDIMDASMGYNASHGCVRLYTDNAEWIYDNVPLNTKVVSY
ncbi:MAG: RICIN domain-containing protein [Parasporobacterium sp.]|nr:RICIN domain-containing protein [Parasporobacterium sp.]